MTAPETVSSLRDRAHKAVATTRAAGGTDLEIAEAVCAAVAEYIREDQACWRIRQAGRRANTGDIQFDSAVTQCIDAVDPQVWDYLER